MNTRTYKTALTFNDRIESVVLTEREHKSFVDRVVIALSDELTPYGAQSSRTEEWIVSLIRDHIGAAAFDRVAAMLAEEGGEG